jgi:hypothetical protein
VQRSLQKKFAEEEVCEVSLCSAIAYRKGIENSGEVDRIQKIDLVWFTKNPDQIIP